MSPDPLTDLARLEGVPSSLAAARDAVDLLLRDRGVRKISPEQVAASLLTGARASARLTSEPDRWISGAVRLSTELPSLAAMLRVAPGQALARAHTLAAYDQVSTEELGRLRAGPDIARRMAGLSDLLTRRSEAPALVLAAVAHAEVATAVPFGSADDLVARAVERMVLISSGFDPPGVIATEVGHEHRAEDYRRLLRAYASGTIDGVRQWILHVATAAVDGAAVGVGKERLSPAE
ncbi:MAG: oxidoreductase [Microlunatus sp.]|nr:oxidoreductase [Microlunatus sp.]MDN5771615.1 oxidoreductase [Microlunatus sp.]MDN5804766.1 oxidoreductase [Microlunatus sp.]